MRRDFVEKWTYVAYICRNLYQIDLLKVRFLSYPWFYTRNIPKIMGTGAECRLSVLRVLLSLPLMLC